MAIALGTMDVDRTPVTAIVTPSGSHVVLIVGTSSVVMNHEEWSRFQDMVRDVQPPAPATDKL